jgi:predicted nucleic acid-binding protein
MYYLDSSAIVKLVVEEPESVSLELLLEGSASITCDLAVTEVIRAARRSPTTPVARANEVLGALSIITLDAASHRAAGLVGPDDLRSLDAIHLAAALELGDDLAGMVTYDERMADAARAVGLRVLAPSKRRE